MSDDSFQFSYCYWMLILATALCPFLWLGSPKDMKYVFSNMLLLNLSKLFYFFRILCSISVVTVISVSIMIWICMLMDNTPVIPPATSPISENPTWRNVISAFGIIAFQFDIHPVLLTIQVDMKSKNKLPCAVFEGFLCRYKESFL